MMRFVLGLMVGLCVVISGSSNTQAQDCSSGQCILKDAVTMPIKAGAAVVEGAAHITKKAIVTVARPVKRTVQFVRRGRLLRCR